MLLLAFVCKTIFSITCFFNWYTLKCRHKSGISYYCRWNSTQLSFSPHDSDVTCDVLDWPDRAFLQKREFPRMYVAMFGNCGNVFHCVRLSHILRWGLYSTSLLKMFIFDMNFNTEKLSTKKRGNVKIDLELMIQCVMATITQVRHFTELHLPENTRLTPPKWNILFFSYGATFLTNSALEENLSLAKLCPILLCGYNNQSRSKAINSACIFWYKPHRYSSDLYFEIYFSYKH